MIGTNLNLFFYRD